MTGFADRAVAAVTAEAPPAAATDVAADAPPVVATELRPRAGTAVVAEAKPATEGPNEAAVEADAAPERSERGAAIAESSRRSEIAARKFERAN